MDRFLGTGAALDVLTLEMSPAPMRFTDNPLDLAIDGPGFFAVLTETGEVAYTRDGRLRVDAEGYLATLDGLLVLGATGPIYVGDGRPVIDSQGQVWVEGACWRAKSPSGSFLIHGREPPRLQPPGPHRGSGEARLGGQHGVLTRASRGRQRQCGARDGRSHRDAARWNEANEKMIQVQDGDAGTPDQRRSHNGVSKLERKAACEVATRSVKKLWGSVSERLDHGGGGLVFSLTD